MINAVFNINVGIGVVGHRALRMTLTNEASFERATATSTTYELKTQHGEVTDVVSSELQRVCVCGVLALGLIPTV